MASAVCARADQLLHKAAGSRSMLSWHPADTLSRASIPQACGALLPSRLPWRLVRACMQAVIALLPQSCLIGAALLTLSSVCAAVVERVGWTNGSHSHKIQEQTFIVSHLLDVAAVLVAAAAAVLGLLALLMAQSVKAVRRWVRARRNKGSKQL